jgi:hypothetical protein
VQLRVPPEALGARRLRVRENRMHGLTGGDWKRSTATVNAKAATRKLWAGARRPTADHMPPRQSPTLLVRDHVAGRRR